MGGARVFRGAAVFSLLAACGGEEFSNESAGGAAGAAASAGAGGTSAGGAAGAGAAAGSSGSGAAGGGGAAGSGGAGGSGGTTGGSGGTTGGGGGTTGGSGGATGGSGGATGGTGGNTGGTGGSTGGAGGTGGAVAGCGVPSAHQGALLLHTTLDNQAAATTPAFMKNPQSGYVSGTFASSGPCNGSFIVDQSSDCVKYSATENINVKLGTIDFFFRPDFEKNDGLSHKLWSLTNTYMQLSKTALPFESLTFGMPGTPIAAVDLANLTFVKGQWTRITVTWQENSGQITATIYLDGVQKTQGTKTFPTTSPPASMYMYIGNLGCNASDHAMGDFDDFKLYDKLVPPS